MKAVILFCNVFFFTAIIVNANNSLLPHEKQQQAKQWIQQQPVLFMENKGQMADIFGKPVPFVLFRADATGMNIYITENGITYLFVKMEDNDDKSKEKENINWSRVDMTLKGANIKKENIVRETPSVTEFNFFYAHCPEGIYGVKQYEKVTIKDIYPGIDWILYNSSKVGMKYDFIVHPGADPSQIKLIYDSEYSANIDEAGNINIKTRIGTLTEHTPYSYLEESREEVRSSFLKNQIDSNKVEITFQFHGFRFSNSSNLIIDPDLTWGTFYGGGLSQESIRSITTDATGNLYVTGFTGSPNFPTQVGTSAFTGAYYNGVVNNGNSNGDTDVFILRFKSNGVREWATYYGGKYAEVPYSITTDLSGNVYVTGNTQSTNFPTRAGAGGFTGAYYNSIHRGAWDIFVLRFSSNGSLEWAILYGGNDYDYAYSITTDISGNVYVTGQLLSLSTNFPTQPGTGTFAGAYYKDAVGGMGACAFILRFSNSGVLQWATLYGGLASCRGHFIATDASGNIYVTGTTFSANFITQAGTGPFTGAYYNNSFGGSESFILRFSNTGVLQWATLYGGSDYDEGYSIVTDASGNIYMTGRTRSSDFPTQPGTGAFTGAYYDDIIGGLSDAFILRFSNNGVLQWATFYGGSYDEARMTVNNNIAVDNDDNVYVAFETTSTDISTFQANCGNYFDGTAGITGGGIGDGFLLEFDNSGSLLLATYVGGKGDDYVPVITTDADDNLYMAESIVASPNSSNTYPLFDPGGGAYYDSTFDAGGFGSYEGFIIKLSPCSQVFSVTASFSNALCNGQCNGQSSANPTGGTIPYTYLWSNGRTTQTITGLCAGTYTVTVTDGQGAVTVPDFIQIEVTDSAEAGIITTPRDTICEGTPAIYTVTGNSAAIQWQSSVTGNDFANIPDADSSYFADFPSQTIFYRVVGGKGNCSDTSAVLKLVVQPSPVAAFSYTGNILQISFNSSGTSGDVTVFDWDFGDSTSSDLPNPVHTFSRSDTFNVCLTVFNGSNCSFTLCKDVIAGITGTNVISGFDEWNIYPVPSSDILFISSTNAGEKIEAIVIYDLLGRLVFQNNYSTRQDVIQINLSQLSKAMYYLEIRTSHENYMQKIIKE